MPVNSQHSEYAARLSTWKMTRDAIAGERVVKAAGPEYLPVPPGMTATPNVILDGNKYNLSSDPYSFYLGFAEFPEIVEPSLAGFQGVIHDRKPTMTLPPQFAYIEEDATPNGESLQTLWSMLTSEVMTTGRMNILIDVDDSDQRLRFIPYSVENLINWRERSPRQGGGADFVILREPQQQIDPKDEFKIRDVIRYRELRLNNGVYQARLWEEQEGPKGEKVLRAIPPAGAVAGSAQELTGWTTIVVNGKTLNFIPFYPINAMDISYTYGPIPILSLVRRAFSIYRKTADYNRALYIKGDPQICIAGIDSEEAPKKVGGDGIWTFPSPDSKAYYLDIDGQGIPLMRQSIRDEYERFDMEGGKLLASDKTAPESGQALKQRQQAQQVNLKNVVTTTGRALDGILKQLVLIGSGNPDSAEFVPDTDFAEPVMSAQELLTLTTAKNNGAPLSYESMHSLMRRGGMTEKSFEDEVSAIEEDSLTLAEIIKPAPAAVVGEHPPGSGTEANPEDGDPDQREDKADKADKKPTARKG